MKSIDGGKGRQTPEQQAEVDELHARRPHRQPKLTAKEEKALESFLKGVAALAAKHEVTYVVMAQPDALTEAWLNAGRPRAWGDAGTKAACGLAGDGWEIEALAYWHAAAQAKEAAKMAASEIHPLVADPKELPPEENDGEPVDR